MSPPAITSPFTEPPQSFGTEGLNIFGGAEKRGVVHRSATHPYIERYIEINVLLPTSMQSCVEHISSTYDFDVRRSTFRCSRLYSVNKMTLRKQPVLLPFHARTRFDFPNNPKSDLITEHRGHFTVSHHRTLIPDEYEPRSATR